MRRSKLPLIPVNPPVSQQSQAPAQLGVLSVHLDGGRCHIGCPFCYLGAREGEPQRGLDRALLTEVLRALPYRELAFALSEPVEPGGPMLQALSLLAAIAHERGKLLSVTTTPQLLPLLPPGALDGAGRISLSIDPFKGPVGAAAVCGYAEAARAAAPGAEIVLIVTLSTQRFARQLLSGLLAALVDLPAVDRVALNAVKPPPHWCDRRFWLSALSRIGPLLQRHLDRRLFLDCYVAARLCGIGGCPARPDLSPAPAGQSGLAFRGCVYQPAPDFVAADAAALSERLAGFVVPPACPFPIE